MQEKFKTRINQLATDPGDLKISIGFEDIDNAIKFYFDNVIRPSVIQNGVKIDVPVVYGSAERWKSVQREGYYRDGNNKIMAPFIMYKSNNIKKDRSITNKIDANYPHNYIQFSQTYNNRNKYDNFSVLNNRIPEETNYIVVVPDYVRITYDCVILTYYTDQLKKLIEAINYASDSYWGDPKKFKFITRVSDFNTPVEVNQDGERTVRCTFSLELFGYIIPDSINKELRSIKKVNKKTKFRIKSEVVGSIEEIERLISKKIPTRYNKYLIKNIYQPYPIKVDLGTSIEDLNLPPTLALTYGNNELTYINVTWDSLNYNPDITGQYTFLAQYDLPPNVTGSKPHIYMIVQVGEGIFINPDEFLRVENRLSEFDTKDAKKEARINIELQVIDEGEY